MLLDYLLKNGSQRFVQECKRRVMNIKQFTRFTSYDSSGRDIGVDVRARAKMVLDLLHDDLKLKDERKNAKKVLVWVYLW